MSFSIVRVEHELLLGRLKTVEGGYDIDSGCMEGTRQSILTQIMAWVTNPLEDCDAPRRHTYWFYGSPGIGKTSLAHSICEQLHDQKHLAGAFFCRRDDPNLSEPRNVLPTLINKLAGIFPPFRSIVAEHLRNDPNLTSKSMKYTLFLDFIHNLPRHPKHALVFVIDAIDECGNDQSRQALLKVLTDAAVQVPWLKIIITSRPEVDIQIFFKSLTLSTHLQCDLAADEEATSDLRIFAKDRLSRVALKRHLRSPWPEQSLFDGVISRAAGLFIFIKTVALALERCEDPTEFLKATLQDSTSTGLKSLYGLYSSILKARIVHSNAKFCQMMGVLLATAPYRPLREETVAELASVDLSYVETWVDDLSSLLYRDDGANGGIRIRHLSISDFFVSDHCDYRVNLQDTHVQVGLACLKTMVGQLCFNICKLEDSRLANADVKDLPSRIRQHIPDSLQYSSLYWSNHLCSAPDNRDGRVLGGLTEFFEGLSPLFWIEVLSILGVVPIAAPSLRRVVRWVKVSTTPACTWFMILIYCRMPTRPFLRESKMPVVSSSPSTPPSLSVLRTRIFQRNPSYRHSRLYQLPSVQGLLEPSRCNKGSCCHGQLPHWNGSVMPIPSVASVILPMGSTLSLGPTIGPFGSGMLRPVLQSGSHWRGIPGLCCPSHILQMGNTSSLHPVTGLFEFGMLKLVQQLANL